MCIRDSFERGIEYARVVLASYFRAAVACSHDAMVVGATPKTFASSAWVRSFSARNLLSPVSYTHLDVYKRQVKSIDNALQRVKRKLERYLEKRESIH